MDACVCLCVCLLLAHAHTHWLSHSCDTSHWVAMSGDISTAKWLLEKGVTMTSTNAVGHTCMHKAAQLGHADFVKFLVTDLGISPRRIEPDAEGKSPAALAAEAGHDALAAWLDATGERP